MNTTEKKPLPFAHFTYETGSNPGPCCMTIRRNRLPARFATTTVLAKVTCERCKKSRAFKSRMD